MATRISRILLPSSTRYQLELASALSPSPLPAADYLSLLSLTDGNTRKHTHIEQPTAVADSLQKSDLFQLAINIYRPE